MTRLAASFPVIGELRLLDADGKILSRANANCAMPLQVSSPAGQDDTLAFPLPAQPGGPVLASLRTLPNDHRVADGSAPGLLDAATAVAAAREVCLRMPSPLTHHRNTAITVAT